MPLVFHMIWETKQPPVETRRVHIPADRRMQDLLALEATVSNDSPGGGLNLCLRNETCDFLVQMKRGKL